MRLEIPEGMQVCALCGAVQHESKLDRHEETRRAANEPESQLVAPIYYICKEHKADHKPNPNGSH